MAKLGDEIGKAGAMNILLSTLEGVTKGQDVIGAQDAAIQAQEKRGQENLVNSSQLPTQIRPANGKAVLEAAGVNFLGVDPDDELFQNVELPPDWKKVGTNHDMHSNLVDETGTIRASIFYKAAFYDRRASMSVVVE